MAQKILCLCLLAMQFVQTHSRKKERFGARLSFKQTCLDDISLFIYFLNLIGTPFNNLRRKVLLLFENCSAQLNLKTFCNLQNVELFFLPPNNTSRLRPFDAGTIGALKVCYRGFWRNRTLDMAQNKNLSHIYKVNILSSSHAFWQTWLHLGASFIANCRQYTEV